MSDGASFLPRIESVFYAVFDVDQGPKIISQVPEGLIVTPSSGPTSGSSSSTLYAGTPVSSTSSLTESDSMSRTSSLALNSPTILQSSSRNLLSPPKRSISSNRFLFNFDDISKYVMPQSPLCGRLVICTTRAHRILGFPVLLKGDHYARNEFRYNLCFVFDRTADLSCYEPVVRKVSRVLTTCEEESAFLSSPRNLPVIHAILEQLYEDLNSYSETSIPIDDFNSIELKIFPFYPNPPPVEDWQVPIALIGLANRIEPNWDLTMAKVCRFIDGINHVSRIARLAECDINLTRKAISHLLYYQVIMMIDIFQYSNMYALRKSTQWLADEDHIVGECPMYTAQPKRPFTDWPTLLHLYSRLKPGKTVWEWMEEHHVNEFPIDVRRFMSFGVIKGFLRRVHRWPVLLPEENPGSNNKQRSSSSGKKRGKGLAALSQIQRPPSRPEPDPLRARGRLQEAQPTIASVGAELVAASSSMKPVRHASAAETSLEQLRSRNRRAAEPTGTLSHGTLARLYSAGDATGKGRSTEPSRQYASSSPDALAGGINIELDSEHSSGGKSATLRFSRPRVSREPSAPMAPAQATPPFPPELLPLLDGEHHTDELCTRFEVGWPVLKQWLIAAGGGKDGDEEDFGQVLIIYR